VLASQQRRKTASSPAGAVSCNAKKTVQRSPLRQGEDNPKERATRGRCSWWGCGRCWS